MVTILVVEARRRKWRDVGVAIAVAFAALLRMGEATSTTKHVFDPSEDLAEHHLTFLLTFWQADRVEIKIGKSKTDRTGAKSRKKPE